MKGRIVSFTDSFIVVVLGCNMRITQKLKFCCICIKKHGKVCRFDKNIVVVLNDMIFLCVLSCPVMAHCFDANSLPQALHCLDLSQMV